MSRWFEVKAVTVKFYAVEVEDDEDEEDAVQAVQEEGFSGDTQLECEGERLGESSISSLKRHADEVLELPPKEA